MSDVGGEFTENCGFEGKILCEVPQGAHGCDSRDTCDTPATEYTPPEGWRVLAVGELLQPGDQVVQLHDGKRFPTERVGQYVCETQRYIRPIEPQPEPEKLPEGCRNDGGWSSGVSGTEPEPWPEPQPEPQPPVPQDADQMIRLLSEANHNHVAMIGRLQGRINDLETIRDTQAATIEESRSEVSHVQWLLDESRQRVTHLEELVTSLRNSNKAHEKAFTAVGKANTDLQHRLNVVSAEWAEQAETIKRLQARIFDLETINQAMEKAVNDAGKANNKLRTQAEEFRFEISYLQNLLGEERAKQADKLAQLETLQPIAAACHTAQTMVRDMLGHMRCLLALHHTTDRRSFCTLLESILEVFDEAECDEDEDDDTTCTSEAGQG